MIRAGMIRAGWRSDARLALAALAALAVAMTACGGGGPPAGAPPAPAAADSTAPAPTATAERPATVPRPANTATEEQWRGEANAQVEELFEGRFPGVRVLRLADGSLAIRLRGAGTFYGNDCSFSTLPTTGKGMQHFPPGVGALEPWDEPQAEFRALEDAAIGLSIDSYEFPIEHPIPLASDPATFSWFRTETDLTLYFSIPLPDIEVREARSRYRKGLVLYDMGWNEITRWSEEMDALVTRVPVDDGKTAWYLLDLFRVRILPGTYHYALQVEDLQGEGVGVLKGTLRVPRYAPTGLALSDLVLSAGIAESGRQSRFQRYGHTILALPTAPAIAPRMDMGNEDYEKFRARTIRMTCMTSVSGLPQVTIPVGTVAGCPAGLSFIGWRGGDEALLDLAVAASKYCGIET